MAVERFFGLHLHAANGAVVGEQVGEVEGLDMVAHVAPAEASPAAHGAHKFVLLGARVRVVRHVNVQGFRV